MPGRSYEKVLTSHISTSSVTFLCSTVSAPYGLVKGQQMKKLLSESAEPVINLVTNMEEGQSSQLQVSITSSIVLQPPLANYAEKE